MTDMDTTMPATTDRRKRRGGAFLRLGIAAVAILGVGGALTSAAWTQIANFNAQATTETFGLRVSVDGGTSWQEVTSANHDITLAHADLTGMTPATGLVVFDVVVENRGSTPMALTLGTAQFTDLTGVSVTTDFVPGTLAFEDTNEFHITVNPADLPMSTTAQDGSFTIQLTANQA